MSDLIVSIGYIKDGEESPQRPPPGLVISENNSQDSAYSCLMAMIYCSKRIQSKISKGKRPMAKPEGNQAQASRSPFLVETHKTGLITPAIKCKNTHEMCTGEAH